MKKLVLFTISILLIAATAVSQFAGDLDDSFANAGIATYNFGSSANLTNAKIQPDDQKIVAVGTAFSTTTFGGDLMAVRLMPDGTFDPTFGVDGKVVYHVNQESYGYECHIKSDGKILIVGAAANPNYEFAVMLVRLNSDGSLDDTFGSGGIVQANISNGDDFGYAFIELSNNKIVVAGRIANGLNQGVPMVMRFNENGSVDTTFGVNGVAQITVTNTDNQFRRIAEGPNGSLIACGHYDMGITFEGGINFDILLYKLNQNGTPDVNFGTNGEVKTAISNDQIDDAFDLEILPSGQILVCGYSSGPEYDNDIVLLRYATNGSLDASFDNDGIASYNLTAYDVGLGMTIQEDNKILICGSILNTQTSGLDFIVARILTDGTLDYPFGTYGYTATPVGLQQDDANDIVLQEDGKIVVVGKTMTATNNEIAVARYHAENVVTVQETNASKAYDVFPNPVSSGQSIQIFNAGNQGSIRQIDILDLAGKVIYTGRPNSLIAGAHSTFTLPVSLTGGMYILNIQNDQMHSRAIKLQIQN